MWTGQQLDPETPLYNMPFRFDLFGEIEREVFVKAFDVLLQECDIMRARFHRDEEGLPYYIIEQSVEKIECVDLSEHSEPDATLRDKLHLLNRESLDIQKRCWNSILFKLSDQHYVWYLNQHHLVTDAWACSVQYKRLAEIYASLLSEGARRGGVQAFVQYSQELQEKQASAKKKDYWIQQVDRIEESPNWYNHRSTRFDTASTRYQLELDSQIKQQIDDLCMEPDLRCMTDHLTRYCLYLSTYFALLHRISSSTTLSIGTPAHNRYNRKQQNSPGPFITFFPIVVEIDENESFGSLFQKVKTLVMEFMMKSSPVISDITLSKSYNAVLNYIHAEYGDFGEIKASSEWMACGHIDRSHDLRLHVMESSEGSKLMLDLKDEIFSKEQASSLQEQLVHTLRALSQDRSQRIGSYKLFSQRDEEILSELDQRGETSAPSLHDQLRYCLKHGQDEIALCLEAQKIPYRELRSRLASRISELKSLGLQPGDRVLLYQRRSIGFMLDVWSIILSGASFIPVAKSSPINRVRNIVLEAGPKAIIADDTLDLACPQWPIAQDEMPSDDPVLQIDQYDPDLLAYTIYTSGSTGKPKGVNITRANLAHYLHHCLAAYLPERAMHMPLFSNVGFDLTITSMFLPWVTGGSLEIIAETAEGFDMSIKRVAESSRLNAVKLTPSHLEIYLESHSNCELELLILGGENLTSKLAQRCLEEAQNTFGRKPQIINEYGPTEATVGCITYAYQGETEQLNVPVGKPISGMRAEIKNSHGALCPVGVTGELMLSGRGIAQGYEDATLNEGPFIDHSDGTRSYRTGDLAYVDHSGVIHFLGRADDQVKLNGHRVELGEVESQLELREAVKMSACVLTQRKQESTAVNCVRCGLPEDYPGVSFDDEHLCDLCKGYEDYAKRVSSYFRKMDELQSKIVNARRSPDGYDCMMLLSGGKDSSYALARLVGLGARVLAFTLDNGYISLEALANVKRVCSVLEVDHMTGETEHMNKIFVDSLERYDNVCNGCFKTIYTLSFKEALRRDIPYIVTGLSRGQFFETRLTEEIFVQEELNDDGIDSMILSARKAYHRENDLVNELLGNQEFVAESAFEQVQFVDFYRYCDSSLTEMYRYLDQKLPWIRPSDTGRSTNCLINQAGIYVHKANRGYSNYAFPYSWDVRVGHKNRDESLDEINEEINEAEVQKMLDEIGYDQSNIRQNEQLICYYTGEKQSELSLKKSLAADLPSYMIPGQIIHLSEMPLTANGKIDRQLLALKSLSTNVDENKKLISPRNAVEQKLADIWKELLGSSQIGMDDRFMELGGNSLQAIRLVSRINSNFRLDLDLVAVFRHETIEELSNLIISEIKSKMSKTQ